LKQSRARTFRLDADLDDSIERLASEDRVSVSHLANRALRRYVEWDRARTTEGFVSVPSMLLVKLMAELSEERAHDLGRWAGKQLFLPNLRAGYANLSFEKAENSMRMLGDYGRRFTFEHGFEEGMHTFTIGQKMGRNWSAYYAGSLESIFEGFLGRAVKVTLSDNMCVVQFKGRTPH
jgi:hypothetical protein